MKKPQAIRKPRQYENNPINESDFEKIGDIPNKLEPQQFINLEPQQFINLVEKLATVGFEYAKECQKTEQTVIKADVINRETDARLENDYLEYEKGMAEIHLEDRKDQRQFEKDMKNLEITATELENKDKYKHRILDLYEAGKISPDILANLIHEPKK